jgi:hypothetical protein
MRGKEKWRGYQELKRIIYICRENEETHQIVFLKGKEDGGGLRKYNRGSELAQ